MIMKKIIIVALISGLFLIACKSVRKKTEEIQNKNEWVSLLDENSLKGWVVKITRQPLGENYKNTFQVQNGVLSVDYDAYDNFNDSFGHIFYDKEYSDYKFRMEYRFTGEQLAGGGNWAKRNSGIMVHCENPRQMGIDQKFPVSLEVQLLGGLGDGERTTGNVCTPGTHVVIDGELIKKHCVDSNSKTYDGDQWVKVEVEVRNDSIIKHYINNELVLEYANFEVGGKVDANKELWQSKEGKPLSKGFISLQSESHPCEFRNIEIMEL